MASVVGQPIVRGFVLRARIVPTFEVGPRSHSVIHSGRRLARTGSMRFLTMISAAPRVGHDQRPNVLFGPVVPAVGQPIVGGFVRSPPLVRTRRYGYGDRTASVPPREGKLDRPGI